MYLIANPDSFSLVWLSLWWKVYTELTFRLRYIQVQILPLPHMGCVALGLDFHPCEMGIAMYLMVIVMMEWLPQVEIPGTCQELKKWWPMVFFPLWVPSHSCLYPRVVQDAPR